MICEKCVCKIAKKGLTCPVENCKNRECGVCSLDEQLAGICQANSFIHFESLDD